MKGCGAIAFATNQKSKRFWTCIFLKAIRQVICQVVIRRCRGAVLALEWGGRENLWPRPSLYRPVVAPWASLRPLVSLRLPARLGPKLGPPAGPCVFVAGTASLVVT
jgi:hypothetical protein